MLPLLALMTPWSRFGYPFMISWLSTAVLSSPTVLRRWYSCSSKSFEVVTNVLNWFKIGTACRPWQNLNPVLMKILNEEACRMSTCVIMHESKVVTKEWCEGYDMVLKNILHVFLNGHTVCDVFPNHYGASLVIHCFGYSG